MWTAAEAGTAWGGRATDAALGETAGGVVGT